jgi:hypothetical protein
MSLFDGHCPKHGQACFFTHTRREFEQEHCSRQGKRQQKETKNQSRGTNEHGQSWWCWWWVKVLFTTQTELFAEAFDEKSKQTQNSQNIPPQSRGHGGGRGRLPCGLSQSPQNIPQNIQQNIQQIIQLLQRKPTTQ